MDFRKVLNAKSKFKDDDVLVYLDPPYFEASKGIYNIEFSKQDHLDLCKFLQKFPYRFVLSYDRSDELKKMYDWANIDESTWTYYMSEERRQEGKELIITNFRLNHKLDELIK